MVCRHIVWYHINILFFEEPALTTPSNRFAHLPDYQRLCDLTRKIPELNPDDLWMLMLLRGIAGEMDDHIEQSLDRYEISEGRLRVLGYLLERERPVSHSELAQASGVTKGTITGLINGLVRDGLVQRVACECDRRVSYVELTRAGERALKKILPGHLARMSELVRSISKEDQQTLVRILETMRRGLQSSAESEGSR